MNKQTLQMPIRSAFALDRARAALFAGAAAAALLSGCSSLEPAPVPIVDRSDYSEASSRAGSTTGTSLIRDSGRTHVVAPGDTLYNISVRYGLDSGELARLNAVSDPTQLRLGQVLHLPESVREPRTPVVAGGVRVSRVTTGDTSQTSTASKPAEETAASTSTGVVPAEKTTETAAGSASAQTPAKTEAQAPVVVPGTRMLWPARGNIIADYAKNGKGLDIGGTAGSVVVAAADGTVLFVGDGVKGYGNLVIVKHSPTLVTAYGHNSKVVVKLNDKVKAGQKIAEMGSTDADQTMLRFEVRDKGKPVDPMKYLAPKRQ